jgi:hypothetical protein
VKEFNVLPINVIQVNYQARPSDYILIKLIVDRKLRKEDREIFMTAVSPQHAVNEKNEIILPNLKISTPLVISSLGVFSFPFCSSHK